MKHKHHALLGCVLALLSAAAGAADAPPKTSPATGPVSAQSAAAARNAVQQKVDLVLRSGRLTPEDISQLRPLLDELPAKEALAFRVRLAEAINRRTLTPTQQPLDLP